MYETDVDPSYYGLTDTSLTLWDVRWQEFGDPRSDHDGGCWRYTFQLNSSALALVPTMDSVDWEETNDDGEPIYEVTGDHWTLADSSLHARGDRCEDIDLRTKLSVRGPDPEGGDGDGLNPQLDAIAISARRNPNLMRFVYGDNVRQHLRSLRNEDPAAYDEYTTSLGQAVTEQTVEPKWEDTTTTNYAEVARLRELVGKKAMPAIGMATTIGGWVNDFHVQSDGAGRILGNLSKILDLITVVKGLQELNDDPEFQFPHWQGFEVDQPDAALGPMTAVSLLMDIYVAPGETTHVRVETEHPADVRTHHGVGSSREDSTDYFPNVTGPETFAHPRWSVSIRAPVSGPSIGAATEQERYRQLFGSANIAWGDFEHDQGQPPKPGLALDATEPASTGEPVTCDGYGTTLSHADIGAYCWKVMYCPPTADPTDTESYERSASQDWLSMTERLALGKGYATLPNSDPTFEFTPETAGTYDVFLEVWERLDDGSYLNAVATESIEVSETA